MYASPRFLTSKFFVWLCLLLIALPFFFWYHEPLKGVSVPYPRPPSRPVAQFVAHGDSKCLPEVSSELIETATAKRATCRKYSPFSSARLRIAVVTAHFGEPKEHYQMAFQTHLLHSLVHGTEVRVMCDPIVDDLWNKPAFILDILMREMMKPEKERLEWIQWADRDTLILDQCRPISSFLPPEKTRHSSWWHRDNETEQSNTNTTHLLVTRDWNGLNNGVFLLRVNNWAIDLFTDILAFRHYKPDVDLPQHWFNAYGEGGAQSFEDRQDAQGLQERSARRGDYLVHFAGHGHKDEAIREWSSMLGRLGDVWEDRKVLRDVSPEIEAFWGNLGHAG